MSCQSCVFSPFVLPSQSGHLPFPLRPPTLLTPTTPPNDMKPDNLRLFVSQGSITHLQVSAMCFHAHACAQRHPRVTVSV